MDKEDPVAEALPSFSEADIVRLLSDSENVVTGLVVGTDELSLRQHKIRFYPSTGKFAIYDSGGQLLPTVHLRDVSEIHLA